MKYYLFLFSIIFLAGSCASKKVNNLSESTQPKITFSAGGGFAGTYTTYVLLENGQIFKQGATELNTTPAGQIPKEQAEQIFHNYTFLKLDKLDQKSYGNYTYSITRNIDGKPHQLIWEKDQSGTELLQVYYKNVMNAISKHKKLLPDTPKQAKSFKPKKESKKS